MTIGHRPPAGLAALLAAAVVWSCGAGPAASEPSATPTLWASPTAEAYRTAEPSPSLEPTPHPADFPIAVVTRYDDLRPTITPVELAAQGVQGRLLLPCEIATLSLDGGSLILADNTVCLPAAEITAALRTKPGVIALLPPGLVSPVVKVLPIGRADLFGAPSHRALAYPLTAGLPASSTGPASSWTNFDAADVRTLISTGDTCPDRGVSRNTIVLGKGWDWAFDGGSVRYTLFRHSSFHWSVPRFARNDDAGAVSALLSDHEIGGQRLRVPDDRPASPSTTPARASRSIPPFVGALAGRAGVDVVTIGSNHMNDFGGNGIRQTIAALDASGIAHTGAGMNLAEALRPGGRRRPGRQVRVRRLGRRQHRRHGHLAGSGTADTHQCLRLAEGCS